MRSALLLGSVAGLLLAAPISAAPITVKLATSTPRPVVDQPWRYTVTVRSATGAPLPARMKLQLLLLETVVGCWKGGAMVQCFSRTAGEWISFKGKRTGLLRFPVQSLGVKLTFQAIVKAQGQARKLRAPVTVQAT